jgi:effector-binding domain-containing protein
MLTLPAKARRKKQPYLSLRSQLATRNLRRQATLFYSELREFIARRGIEDVGPAFMRYLSIGRDGDLDVEFGYFTSRLYAGAGPVRSGQLPPGVFLTAEWTGPYENFDEVQAMLVAWTQHNGVFIDVTETETGIAYACRLKIFHVSSRLTEDPKQLRTEFAFLTRPAEAEG